ncbi:MAG: hypothetical protein U9O90_02660 [Euryarchaeota archaeon]|nr:hypothetical protein [Euryarchaeota archaeon]
MSHNKEVTIYAVLMFVAMRSLTLMAPVIQEFNIDRFNASNTEASMFFMSKLDFGLRAIRSKNSSK